MSSPLKSYFISHPRAIYHRNIQSITPQPLTQPLEQTIYNNKGNTDLQDLDAECSKLRNTIINMQTTINQLLSKNNELITLNNNLYAQLTYRDIYNNPPLEASAPPAYNTIYNNT